MNIEELMKEPRLLIEVPLRPVQGTRFQPTGFPDLGAAAYQMANGKEMLLVESAQSMANRLEAVCWDESRGKLEDAIDGIPYITVKDEEGNFLTNSIIESHRINSPYILESKDKTFVNILKEELDTMKVGAVNMKRFAKTLMKYDVNALIHGVFLAKKDLAGGRLRLARALSSFVEAANVTVATSGGVKLDHVDPQGVTKKGFGHVPFHREEFTGDITAYFNLDISQIRGYGLGSDAEKLLVLLSFYKIMKVLECGLRFRTACDLEMAGDIVVKRPENFQLPSLTEIENALPEAIENASHHFAEPMITEVVYKK